MKEIKKAINKNFTNFNQIKYNIIIIIFKKLTKLK